MAAGATLARFARVVADSIRFVSREEPPRSAKPIAFQGVPAEGRDVREARQRRGDPESMRGPVCIGWLAPLAIAAAAGSGCAGAPEPVEACLRITPSEKLHTFNGQPHVLPIYVYSLSSALAFERMEVPALLANDQKIEGVVGGPLEVMVYPGQVVEFHEVL